MHYCPRYRPKVVTATNGNSYRFFMTSWTIFTSFLDAVHHQMHFYPRNRSKVIVYQVNHATKGNNVQLFNDWFGYSCNCVFEMPWKPRCTTVRGIGQMSSMQLRAIILRYFMVCSIIVITVFFRGCDWPDALLSEVHARHSLSGCLCNRGPYFTNISWFVHL